MELLISIAVMAILIGLLFPVAVKTIENGRQARCVHDEALRYLVEAWRAPQHVCGAFFVSG